MKRFINSHHRMNWICLIGIFVIIEFVSSFFIGKYPLSFENIIAGDAQSLRVLLTLRIPRGLVALVGGFAFGVTGMVYQTVFRNPLASPDIIGVASGASAGAAFAILFLGGSTVFVTGSAFAGSMIAVGAALALSSLVPGKSKMTIVLSGIAVNSLAQTVLTLLKLTADPEKELSAIEYWIMGSLNAITLQEVPIMVFLNIICMALLVLLYRQVLLLSVEEEEAALLGISVAKSRALILVIATLMTASVVSITGVISFVGLLAPHIARVIMKDNRLATLWLSGLCGSALLMLADILVRTVSASELPVSVFTSLLGVPFLFYFLRKNGVQ